MRSARKKATRKTTAKRPKVRKGAKAWSSAEIATLRQAYRTKSATEIAKMLRRTVSSVKAKARTLKLRKPVRRKAAGKKATKKKATRKATAKRKGAVKRRRR
ncbi:MAG: hypothetical protein ACE5K8_03055 [Candidatus Zixiibacteriota bacterium]